MEPVQRTGCESRNFHAEELQKSIRAEEVDLNSSPTAGGIHLSLPSFKCGAQKSFRTRNPDFRPFRPLRRHDTITISIYISIGMGVQPAAKGGGKRTGDTGPGTWDPGRRTHIRAVNKPGCACPSTCDLRASSFASCHPD